MIADWIGNDLFENLKYREFSNIELFVVVVVVVIYDSTNRQKTGNFFYVVFRKTQFFFFCNEPNTCCTGRTRAFSRRHDEQQWRASIADSKSAHDFIGTIDDRARVKHDVKYGTESPPDDTRV